MEWEGDEGRGRHARRENVLDVGRAQESQNLRSRGPVDLTLLGGRQTCQTTAVPEQARQEGSEEGRERAQETRKCTSTGRQGEGTQAGGLIRNQQGFPRLSFLKSWPVLWTKRKPNPVAAPHWGLLPAPVPLLVPALRTPDSGSLDGAQV